MKETHFADFYVKSKNGVSKLLMISCSENKRDASLAQLQEPKDPDMTVKNKNQNVPFYCQGHCLEPRVKALVSVIPWFGSMLSPNLPFTSFLCHRANLVVYHQSPQTFVVYLECNQKVQWEFSYSTHNQY